MCNVPLRGTLLVFLASHEYIQGGSRSVRRTEDHHPARGVQDGFREVHLSANAVQVA